ncbi:MAG TPA: hypothetical protein VGM41_18735 [Chitinophagaceae bacterium]|jgi:hypothetical protein
MNRLLILLAFVCAAKTPFAQDTPALSASDAAKVDKLSQQYVAAVGKKSDEISAAIDKTTQQYLDRLQKQELKLQKRMAKVDSVKAHNVFASSAAKYQQLKNDINNRAQRLQRSTGRYLPFTDTAATSLKFLSGNPFGSKLPVNPSQLKDALGKVNALEAQLKQAENVKEFIRQRKEYLKQQLASDNMGSDLKKYNSTAWYYIQQINDYKKSLSDPTKAEQKALALLRQYGPFQSFMAKNSVLAGLFNVPADYGTTSLNGLQTVSQVQNLLQSRISNLGPNAMQTVQASLGAAQSELSKLRNRFPQAGSTGDMPDMNPQATKTQSFKKRLLFGLDMQTTKTNGVIPTYTDFALTAGYRALDRLTFTVGISYKMGWGQDLRHIHLSSQGMGLRSGLDFKVKRSFFLTAGAEANYLSAFKSIKELRDYSAWSMSALTGVSKTVSLKTKFFKNTRVSVLYDWLHAAHIPATPAFVFRAGYNF